MPIAAISTHTASFSNLRRAADFPLQTAIPYAATDYREGEAVYIVDDEARLREALSDMLYIAGQTRYLLWDRN